MGLGAVLLWSLLAPLTVGTGAVPPMLLTGLAFLTGGTLGLCVQLALGRGLAPVLRVPALAWLLGVGGFFGYHVVYFTALRLLPPVEALLIINTWPLLIILLTALIPGERLLPRHLVGGAMGLTGAALIVLARDSGAEGVRTRGLRWPLDGEPLALGDTRAISNEPIDPAEARVSLERGLLLLTRHFPR